jgi:hypothetical protein
VCEVAAMLDKQMKTFSSQLKKTTVKTVPLHHNSRHPWCGCNKKGVRNMLEVLPQPRAVPTSHHATFIPLFHVKGITWSRVWQFEEVKKKNSAYMDSVTPLPSSVMGSGSLWLVTKGV